MQCIRCGNECNTTLCSKCNRSHNLCECGKVKQRKVKQCKDCRPIKKQVMCVKCGTNPRQVNNPVCKECYINHKWTQQEDDFFKEYYPDHGIDWCAQQAGLSPKMVRSRVGMLGLRLNKDTYRSIVHGAASVANKGRKYTPEQNEANRKRCMDNIEMLKTYLLKGRLANQKDKPSGLERKLWNILKELNTEFESQVEIKKSFIVDIRIGSLIIEADGDYWHGHSRFEPLTERQLKQHTKDKSKDAYLSSCGYAIERVWESNMSYAVIKDILIKHNILTSV